jgi:hypothetical protein
MSAAMQRAGLCLILTVTGVALLAPALADSVPFWGAKDSVPIDTPITQLKKGEFLWMADAVSTGPVVMVVSITEQRAYVYRSPDRGNYCQHRSPRSPNSYRSLHSPAKTEGAPIHYL